MNTSHLHTDPASQREVDAFGLRAHCNVCREKQGLKPLSETERKVLEQAAGSRSAGSGAEPVEQLLADLQAQEDANDQLREMVKQQETEIAQLRAQLEKKKSG